MTASQGRSCSTGLTLALDDRQTVLGIAARAPASYGLDDRLCKALRALAAAVH